MRYLLPWQVVRVDGASMTPTLVPGDVLLVRHSADPAVGEVVLARFHRRPDLLVVKRVSGRAGRNWLLASDNGRAGNDSRTYGPADVLAVVRWLLPGRLHRRLERGRVGGAGRRAGRPIRALRSRAPRRPPAAPTDAL